MDHIQLKKARAEARYMTKTNKNLSWKKFTSSINHKIDPSSLWNKIRSLKGNPIQPIPDRLRDSQNRPTQLRPTFRKRLPNSFITKIAIEITQMTL
jgi:hypothetical protein